MISNLLSCDLKTENSTMMLLKRHRKIVVYIFAIFLFVCYARSWLDNSIVKVGKKEQMRIRKYYNFPSKIITPLNYTFLESNPFLCSHNPLMLIMVPSAPDNNIIRNTIRLTYARFGTDMPIYSTRENSTVHIQVVFLVGMSNDTQVNEDVKQEFKDFKDIVVADFVDSYYNLTLKLLLGLKWTDKYCKSAQYVHKIDDDVFLNVPLLLSTIESFPQDKNGSVFGSHCKSGVKKIGKWGVTKAEYPLKKYPHYIQGTSYTLTSNLVGKIVDTSQHLPYLHIEDAFITGIVAAQVLGASHVYLNGSSRWKDPLETACDFINKNRIAQTKMSPQLMTQIWLYLKYPEQCKLEKELNI